MRIILLCSFIIMCLALNGQQVISSSGGTMNSSTGSLSFTIGEGVASTLTKGDKIVTQGFQQSNLAVSILNEAIDLNFSLNAFPNPTKDILNLSTDKDDISSLQFRLYDSNGKMLMNKKFDSSSVTIIFDQYPYGIYFIKVIDGLLEVKLFKIIKM